jgi:tRNA/tmRNA/rRNA uracil-C5-methylase (TrmA/RlmC/RlmD family)
MQRAMGALRATLPLVQRILPLLDGNIGAAVSNILAPQHRAPAPAPPPVNLAPIKESLAELETRHRALSDQLVEQNSSLKRVEDQLGMVREATDRNTLEQQELLEDLKGVGQKVNMFAFFALGLLLFSVVVNVVLIVLLHNARVIP